MSANVRFVGICTNFRSVKCFMGLGMDQFQKLKCCTCLFCF